MAVNDDLVADPSIANEDPYEKGWLIVLKPEDWDSVKGSLEWRLMILCQLAEGEKTVSELQAALGLSQSALSQHLAVLRRERIVSSRKHAQSVSYSLAGTDAPKVMQTLHEVFCKTRGDKRA